MDSPWDEDASPDAFREAEWSKMSSEFTTTGYREGITAGKESALQEGFDNGFASVGVPIGREVGILRGMISAILASESMSDHQPKTLMDEARDIASQLAKIRFSEIAPRDLEAEAHAKEHLETEDGDGEMEENEELAEKRKMEGLEDMLNRMTAGSNLAPPEQPKLTMEDVQRLKTRILALCATMGAGVNWN